jgi:hypothetical protein
MRAISNLERFLVDGIKAWTSEVPMYTGEKDPVTGEKLVQVPAVYRGFLHIRMTGGIDPSIPKIFPHIIVQSSSGEYDFQQGEATVNIQIGVWDDAPDLSGYQDALILSELLIDRIYTERIIGNNFPLADAKVTWKLVEGSDLFPSFFAILTLTVNVATPSPRFDSILISEEP